MTHEAWPTEHATLEWADPAIGLASLPELSGFDYLEGIRAGRIPPPPMAATMAMDLRLVGEGTVEFDVTPHARHLNPLGVVHGGLACTVLDTVAGCAGQTTLPAGVGYTSIDLQVGYLRPIMPTTEPLRAVGRVVKGGRRVIFTEAELFDPAGDALATATSSLLVIDRRGN
ncbi:PaaI family thioesterase [Agromyces sp. SYSU T00194]|uniref:PaaI family thioesterase n=1 Tax=Agromyces chitinivorans TaxID=3158560 RepID=UPI0033916775